MYIRNDYFHLQKETGWLIIYLELPFAMLHVLLKVDLRTEIYYSLDPK